MSFLVFVLFIAFDLVCVHAMCTCVFMRMCLCTCACGMRVMCSPNLAFALARARCIDLLRDLKVSPSRPFLSFALLSTLFPLRAHAYAHFLFPHTSFSLGLDMTMTHVAIAFL